MSTDKKGNPEVADLQAENARLKAELEKAKAAPAAAQTVTLVSAEAAEAERSKASNAAKRAALKASAPEEDGQLGYLVGDAGAYRNGRTYAAGEEIWLKKDEEPSVTFKPLVPAPKPAFKGPTPAGRPSDAQV